MLSIFDLFKKKLRYLFQNEWILYESLKKIRIQVPPTRFVIIGASRTGTTLLRLMLNSHPDIISHGEIFAKAMRGFVGIEHRSQSPLKQWLVEIRDSDPVFFLENIAFLSGAKKAIGFKILYRTVRDTNLRLMLNIIQTDNEIKIIHIIRKNRLKRLISQKRANLSGISVLLSDKYRPKLEKVNIQLKDLIKDIHEIENEENSTRTYFKNHPIFEIEYEDIVGSKHDSVELLQKFLGVQPAQLNSPTLKLSSENLNELLENYEELKLKTKRTPYENYFER